MKSITAIAIDDEPIALEIIRAHVSPLDFIKLEATFTDPMQAISYLETNPVDVLFTDIRMPDINGIELYNGLQRKPMLIFTTAFDGHAVTSFEMDAVDYLLKPFSPERFAKACQKVFDLYTFRSATQNSDHLYLRTGYEQVKVLYKDILYLEATGNYVTFVTKDRKILSRSTFAEIAAFLPEEKFVRIHRSFIVAVDKIDRIERHQITIGNLTLPVSESYKSRINICIDRLRLHPKHIL
jgi:DNA-binding LytR/AlgR family response regulator